MQWGKYACTPARCNVVSSCEVVFVVSDGADPSIAVCESFLVDEVRVMVTDKKASGSSFLVSGFSEEKWTKLVGQLLCG
jgi:hypothetical protein